MELMGCPNLAVPADVMHHVVHVESSFNPYAIGVVGGRLARQPANLPEAVATARMLESRGFNFSLGLAQVNRYNLARYGIASYEQAFQACRNLQAGSRILAECHDRSGRDWGKSFSCYYSGNFVTGFRQGYVQKIYASMRQAAPATYAGAIPVYGTPSRRSSVPARASRASASAPSRIEAATSALEARIAAQLAAPPAPQAVPAAGAASPVPPAAAPADPVVVLQPGGLAPRVAGSDGPASPPSARELPAPAPRDAAFVF